MSLRIFCILLVFNNILIYFPDGSSGKESACNAGNLGSIPGLKDPQEKEMSTYSYFCWKIPWTEDPGGLQSMGLQRVGHDWATNTFTFMLVRYSLGLGLTTRAVLTESFIWALYINIFGNLCTLNSGKPNYSQVCVRLRCGSSYFFLIFLFLTFNIFIISMLESRPRQKI